MAQFTYPIYEYISVDTGPREISSSNFEKLNQWMLLSATGKYNIDDFITIKEVEDWVPPYMTSVFIDSKRDGILYRTSQSLEIRDKLYDVDYSNVSKVSNIIYNDVLEEYRLIPPEVPPEIMHSLNKLYGAGMPVLRESPWPNEIDSLYTTSVGSFSYYIPHYKYLKGYYNLSAVTAEECNFLSNVTKPHMGGCVPYPSSYVDISGYSFPISDDYKTLSDVVIRDVLWQDEIYPTFPHAFLRSNNHWVPSAAIYMALPSPEYKTFEIPLSGPYYTDTEYWRRFLNAKNPWFPDYKDNPMYNKRYDWDELEKIYNSNPTPLSATRYSMQQPLEGTVMQLVVETQFEFDSATFPGAYAYAGERKEEYAHEDSEHFYVKPGSEYDDYSLAVISKEEYERLKAAGWSNILSTTFPEYFAASYFDTASTYPQITAIPEPKAKYIVGEDQEEWPYYKKIFNKTLKSSTTVNVKYNNPDSSFPWPWFRFGSVKVTNPTNVYEDNMQTYINLLSGIQKNNYPYQALPFRNRPGQVIDWIREENLPEGYATEHPEYNPWPQTGLDMWQGYTDSFGLDELVYYNDACWHTYKEDTGYTDANGDTIYKTVTMLLPPSPTGIALFSAFSPDQYAVHNELYGDVYDLRSNRFTDPQHVKRKCQFRITSDGLEPENLEEKEVDFYLINPWAVNSGLRPIGDFIKSIQFYYPYQGINTGLSTYNRNRDPFYWPLYPSRLDYPYWYFSDEEDDDGNTTQHQFLGLSTLNSWVQPQQGYHDIDWVYQNVDGKLSAIPTPGDYHNEPRGYDRFSCCGSLRRRDINGIALKGKMYAIVEIDILPYSLNGSAVTENYRRQIPVWSDEYWPWPPWYPYFESYNYFNQRGTTFVGNMYHAEGSTCDEYTGWNSLSNYIPTWNEGSQSLPYYRTNYFALYESKEDVVRIPTLNDIVDGNSPVIFEFKELVGIENQNTNISRFSTAYKTPLDGELLRLAENFASKFTFSIWAKYIHYTGNDLSHYDINEKYNDLKDKEDDED